MWLTYVIIGALMLVCIAIIAMVAGLLGIYTYYSQGPFATGIYILMLSGVVRYATRDGFFDLFGGEDDDDDRLGEDADLPQGPDIDSLLEEVSREPEPLDQLRS